jgi:sialate O-acetylesterase
MSSLKRSLVLLSFVLTMAISSGHAQQPSKLKVPLAFTDHMVLQNGVEDPVWGTALAGTMVKVDFLDAQNKNLASLQAVADSDGKWSVKLPPLTTGTTGELQIIAGTEAPVVVHDVVVGEAWLCSGQSNMGYTINSPNMPPEWVARAQQEATDAKGNIRFYDGKWEIGTPDTVGRCSAVAWNFAVALHDKLHCPIGLLVEASPGTPVERWMPKAAVDATSVGPAIEKRYQDDAAKFPDLVKQANEADAAWLQANPTPELQAQHKGSRPKKPYRIIHVGELFNWYIQGLVPYGIKGVTWFQADANRAHPEEYGELFKALITSWRQLWQTQLPFYYVEMNNMLAPQQTKPIEPGWLPILREQQEAGLELPGVEVVTSIDTGDPVAVVMQPHFPNKKPVGERLALLALNNLYGMPCEAHSPQYASFTVEGNKIRVKFKYADGLRVRGGGKMIGFAIRGATGDWVWADGQIDGTDILLSSDQVPQPASVRYAWAFNPLISVENGAGLPLRPFRTDKTSQE